jgi:hypothetical protein
LLCTGIAVPQSEGQAIEQGLFGKRFAEKAHSAGIKRAPSLLLVWVRGDENDWDATTAIPQLPLQSQTVHAGHIEIRNDTRYLAQRTARQKMLRGREGSYAVSVRLNQSTYTFAGK